MGSKDWSLSSDSSTVFCGCSWSKATGPDGHAINNHETARDLRHTWRHSQAVTPSHTSNLAFHLHVGGAVHTHSWPARCQSHTKHIIQHKGSMQLQFEIQSDSKLHPSDSNHMIEKKVSMQLQSKVLSDMKLHPNDSKHKIKERGSMRLQSKLPSHRRLHPSDSKLHSS